jgi:hypothetical protein
MVEYNPEARARMRAQAQRFKEGRMGGKHVSLSGQNAIVEQGQTVIVRILPRWDFASKAYTQDPKTKAVVKNPNYQPDEAYIVGIEHWFTGVDGKRKREWCRRCVGEDEVCPLCEAAAAYKGSSDENERQMGNDMEAKDVVLYNVILRKAPFGEDGRPAVKILSVTPTLWLSINRSAGGEDEGFSIGDYTDFETGYDWKIYRPAARKAGVKQESYSAEHAPERSRLYPLDQAARWKGWHLLLHDLEAEIHENTKSYADLYKMIYGSEPETIPGPDAAPAGDDFAGGGDAVDMGGEEIPGAGEELPPDDGVGGAADFDFPPETSAPTPAPAATPPRAAPRRPAAPAPAAGKRTAPPLRPGTGRRR